MLSAETIERAIEVLLQRLAADAALQKELAAARQEFFPGGPADGLPPEGERRLLEWFLLERPSPALGGVPIVALEELVEEPEVVAALRDSTAGVFEVSSVATGEGLWLEDLLHGGQRPVAEEEALDGLAPGDLLIGRLFPVGGGVARLSPAVTCFRNPALARALRTDLEQIRSGRRGVVRVGQAELERLFHGASAGPVPAPSEVRRGTRAALVALGLPPEEAAALIEAVGRAASEGRAGGVTELLNHLAFETEIDLEAARRVLIDQWEAECASRSGPPAAHAGGDVSAALAAFDEGRAAGQDLEALFQKLERDLGLEPEAAGDEDEGVPDFPGVVGAVIEEFLWDTEREHGTARAQGFAVLRCLGAYASDVGVFEELGRAHLVDFAGRWLLDESGLADPDQVAAVLAALEAFCRWTEERHAHPLWTLLEPAWADLSDAVPRLVRFRQQLAASEPGRGPFQVLRVESEAALVAGEGGHEWMVPLTREQASHLRRGDLVRVSGGSDAPRLASGYPKEIGLVLD
jgi:hypothetical protein